MDRSCRTLALALIGLSAGCGGGAPELGQEADIAVDSAARSGLAPSGAVEEVVAQLRGEPGRTIYLAPPDLGDPDPRALFPGPGRQAVLAAPPPPMDTTAEPGAAAARPDAPPPVPEDTAAAAPPDTTRADGSRDRPGRAGP